MSLIHVMWVKNENRSRRALEKSGPRGVLGAYRRQWAKWGRNRASGTRCLANAAKTKHIQDAMHPTSKTEQGRLQRGVPAARSETPFGLWVSGGGGCGPFPWVSPRPPALVVVPFLFFFTAASLEKRRKHLELIPPPSQILPLSICAHVFCCAFYFPVNCPSWLVPFTSTLASFFSYSLLSIPDPLLSCGASSAPPHTRARERKSSVWPGP